MSRVGKKPIAIPSGVKAESADNMIRIQGPKGKLEFKVDDRFDVEIKDNSITVKRPSDNRFDMSKHGMIRTMISNMVIGVTKGYSKELEIRGVGFKGQVQGKKATFNLGYSHSIDFIAPEGITIEMPKQTQVIISGINKAKVGEVAAEIRDMCHPDPYKGKGVRYAGEHVRQKVGKKVA